MKKTLATLALVALAMTANAQLAGWDFTGATGSEATSAADVFDVGLDSSNLLTRGAGATGSAGSNGFRTLLFQNNGISLANTDFYQFTLSGAAGTTMSLSTINHIFAGTASYSATPGVSMQYAYSLDGTNFTLIGSPFAQIGNGAGTAVDLTGISDLQNVADGTTVTFRFYASGQTSTGGWGYSSPSAGAFGLSIAGTVVPEPSTIALLGLGVVASVVALRRKLS